MSFANILRRHRSSILDGLIVAAIVVLVGVVTYEFALLGPIAPDKRITFEEMLSLDALGIATLVYLGWRRVADQEKEIKRRIDAERRAHELANTDTLTGLANRRQFDTELQATMNLPCAQKEVHAVFMLDLNRFKKVNDVYGHTEGDELLVAVAERLMAATRDRDLVARFGGDEFAIIARHLAGPEAATNIALRIIKEFETPIRVGTRQHNIGTGIGIALVPRDGDLAEDVLRKADVALYRAKSATESAVRFFEDEMDKYIREHDFLERELAAAIGTDALRPWYQPLVDLKSGEVVGFEALARWSHPTLGQIPPDRFIPIAEGSGLIHKLGDWLLRCAANDAQAWPENIMLSCNLSPAQLKDGTFGLHILNILAETGLPPRRLEIEITESAIVRDLEGAKDVLRTIREAGLRIALDDFGTGYSSLYHLRSFKLDKIKIDRSFVHAMKSEKESATIVQALTGLGLGLGLTITAEGIEEKDERDALLRLGCQQGQGYLFGRVIPASETVGFFSSQEYSKRAGTA